MKLNNTIFFVLATVLVLGAGSCSKGVKSYEPAQPEDGMQYYFGSENPTAIALTPTTSSIEFTVYRIDTEYGSTASVSVTDTSKTIIAEGSDILKVAFKQGENKSVLSLPIVFDNFEFGDLFGLSMKIEADGTVYGNSTFKFEVSLPEPWKSLGKAKFKDEWIWEMEDYIELPLEQNEIYPNQFRLTLGDDFKKALVSSNQISGLSLSDFSTVSDYLNFRILKAGQKLNDVTITSEMDLVYYGNYDLGYYHASYGADILSIHAASFSSWGADPMGSDESYWVNNYVENYQENGLPTIVHLAPNFYMNGVGGWKYWDTITAHIVFPGYVLKDYTIGLSYEGVFTNKEDEVSLVANVDFVGADVKKVALVVLEGKDVDAALELIDAEDESVVYTTASGTVYLPMAEDAQPNLYTIVAVPVTEEGLSLEDAVYESLLYGNVSADMLPYTYEDKAGNISKEELLSTTWYALATDEEGTPADREFYTKITFEEAEDLEEDSDRILAHGFTYGAAAYYGSFVDDLYFEWYEGCIYNLDKENKGKVMDSYSVYPLYVTSDCEEYTDEDYSIMGVLVDEGIIAFVSAEDDYDYTQIWFGAFSGNNFVGYITCMNYILLVSPEVYEELSDNKSANRVLSSLRQALSPKRITETRPRNYVEVKATSSSKDSQAVACGKVKNLKFRDKKAICAE